MGSAKPNYLDIEHTSCKHYFLDGEGLLDLLHFACQIGDCSVAVDKEDSPELDSPMPNIFDLAWNETRAKHLKILEEYEWTPERLASRAEAVARMRKPTKVDE